MFSQKESSTTQGTQNNQNNLLSKLSNVKTIDLENLEGEKHEIIKEYATQMRLSRTLNDDQQQKGNRLNATSLLVMKNGESRQVITSFDLLSKDYQKPSDNKKIAENYKHSIAQFMSKILGSDGDVDQKLDLINKLSKVADIDQSTHTEAFLLNVDFEKLVKSMRVDIDQYLENQKPKSKLINIHEEEKIYPPLTEEQIKNIRIYNVITSYYNACESCTVVLSQDFTTTLKNQLEKELGKGAVMTNYFMGDKPYKNELVFAHEGRNPEITSEEEDGMTNLSGSLPKLPSGIKSDGKLKRISDLQTIYSVPNDRSGLKLMSSEDQKKMESTKNMIGEEKLRIEKERLRIEQERLRVEQEKFNEEKKAFIEKQGEQIQKESQQIQQKPNTSVILENSAKQDQEIKTESQWDIRPIFRKDTNQQK